MARGGTDESPTNELPDASMVAPTATWSRSSPGLEPIALVGISTKPSHPGTIGGGPVSSLAVQPETKCMNMAKMAQAFGVEGEVAHSPSQLKEALVRARRANAEGKPYLIDAEVRRAGAGWAENPWTPRIERSIARGSRA